MSPLFFENGFRGQLRRGTSELGLENDSLAWRNKFTFRHPELGEKCMLAVKPFKPRTFPGRFGIGCWVCAHHPQKYSSSFARLSVNTKETMGPSAFTKRAQSPSHEAVLKDLDAKLTSPEARASGQVTGQSDVCPRLEKFVLAGQIIARRDSFTDFHEYIKALSVSGAVLQQGSHSDMSPQTAKKIVLALGRPLYQQDQAVATNSQVDVPLSTSVK